MAEQAPTEGPPAEFEFRQRDLERALVDAGLYSFPRQVGTPEQVPVFNPVGLLTWWRAHGGTQATVPLFMSHNRVVYSATKRTAKGRPIIEGYEFGTAFGDFDTGDESGLQPHEVLEEVQRTSRWLVTNRRSHYWKYSGSDCGFHLHVFFQPQQTDWEYLHKWENAFWRGLKNELSLRSVNIRCANPTCHERLPYSRYVHKKDPAHKGEYVATDRYCVPVPWELVEAGDIEAIRVLSRQPVIFDTVRFSGDPPVTLESFVRRKGWEAFGPVPGAFHPMPATPPTGDMAGWMKGWAPGRSCLQMLPFGANPKHTVRLALLFHLMSLDMGAEELFANISAIGREAGWEDYNEERIRYFIDNAVRRKETSGEYSPYSCQTLREHKACLGVACPSFRYEFPTEWAEHVARHPEVALR